MTKIAELGDLFRPVQPRFKEGGEKVSYTELAPDPLLSGYICCYWQLKTCAPLSEGFQYTAVADGCIDFFFDLNDSDEYFVMGFSSAHTSFQLNTEFNYAGIRFFPGSFPSLYNVKASELTERCENIREVIPQHYGRIKDILCGQDRVEDIKVSLDRYFKKMVYGSSQDMDSRVLESVYTMFTSATPLKVEKDVVAGVSSRQLRRLFEFYIGAAPKKFAQVIRFQKFLLSNTSRERLRTERSYYELGYYDQAHFIKSFKTLYGRTPLKAF